MINQFYHQAPPGIDPEKLTGMLLVIEGMDASGRSTQIARLTPWLEQKGYAVVQTGLKRSELVGPALEEAKQGNILSPRTMSLFYATDFYDQVENTIIPALRSGCIVLADRYIFTLMARDIVRGAERDWLESLYSRVVIPQVIFYLKASTQTLLNRTFQSRGTLDYWESGMDVGLSKDWYDSYIRYQRMLGAEFKRMEAKYNFITVRADRTPPAVNRELRMHIEKLLTPVAKSV
jgi:dTMP kinase